MQKLMSQLITDTQRMIYQASGVGVQMYSQDVLMQLLQQAFDHCFTAEFWPSFIRREVRTLDGVTGKTTAPFSLIKEWRDVHSIFRRNWQHPITTLPNSFNLLDLPAGSVIKWVEPSSDNTLFTAYPLGAIDEIVVVGRERPATEFILTQTVPFDNLALCYFAAWSYLVDDASNAGAATKFQGLFDARMKELKDAEFENIVRLAPRSGEVPTQWYTH